MAANRKDIKIVRDLAQQYAELAAKPVQEERRKLWAAHHR
jgi:phage gp46-like protein